MKTALKAPCTAASGCSRGSRVGWTRTETPVAAVWRLVSFSAMASSLMTKPASFAAAMSAARDGADALAVHVFQGETGVEGQRGEDGGLGGGVVAFDVGGGVGFGVAEALGLGQGVGELRAGGVHLVQDEVGGAVDDAQHAGDPVAGEAVADGAQDGDGAGHGGLVGQLDAGLVRLLVEGRAVLGQQRLVAGDHAGAVPHRGQDQGPGRLDPAHQLDDEVGVLDQGLGVGGEQLARQFDVARGVDVAHGDAAQLQAGAGAGGQHVGVVKENPRHLGPDVATAQQGHFQGSQFGHSDSHVAVQQIFFGFPADNQPGRSVAHSDNARPGQIVVVA